MDNLEVLIIVLETVNQDKPIDTNESVEAIKEALIKQRQELEQTIYGINESKVVPETKIEPIDNPITLDSVSPISLSNENDQTKKITPLGSMPPRQDLSIEQKIEELIKYMSVTATAIEEVVGRLDTQEKMLSDIIKINKKDNSIL
jgi:hypothetical protein